MTRPLRLATAALALALPALVAACSRPSSERAPAANAPAARAPTARAPATPAPAPRAPADATGPAAPPAGSTALAVGQRAPDFALPSTEGREIGLETFRGRETLVLAFFPRAFTPG